jgi:putative N6-adenine-specific DNA methylase
VKLFVSCTPGLEPALYEELAEMRLKPTLVEGGADVDGDASWINLHSRIASRVLERIAFVKTTQELARVRFPRAVSTVEGGPPGYQRSLKLQTHGSAALVRAERSGGWTVSLDTSGELLHVRGYREEVGKAPMRETLAAGMLRLSGYSGTEPLWDLMCGSGTLLIEAALIALDIPPGDLKAKPKRAPPFPLLKGTDLNAGALGITRRNARRAGVFEALTLERADATLVKPTGPAGLVVANLPYGKRVAKTDLSILSANLRAHFSGWRFAFLMQGGLTGLTVQKEHALNNGGLRCRLVQGTC